MEKSQKLVGALIYNRLISTQIYNVLFVTDKLKAHSQCLKQYLATESPLKMMKNDFYFTSKVLSILKIFKFLSCLFGHVAKRLDRKDKFNFKL